MAKFARFFKKDDEEEFSDSFAFGRGVTLYLIDNLSLDKSEVRFSILNNEDKNFILQHFFDANYANMILKRSYYSSLYNKRYSKDNISTDAFSNQEYADIMANFTLCWIDKKFVEIFPNLKYLMEKEENYIVWNLKPVNLEVFHMNLLNVKKNNHQK